MRPIKYTHKDGKTIFHYDYDSLRRFVYHGKKYGDVGKILTGRTGDIFHYAGYGNYANPNKALNRISVRHSVAFDGEMKSDEEIVFGKSISDVVVETTGFKLLNFSSRRIKVNSLLGKGEQFSIEADFPINQGNTDCDTIKQIINDIRR